jgi:hypothetical protein
MTVPPPLHTGEPGSFAHESFRVRIPEILATTRAQLGPVPAGVDAALDELDRELRTGVLRPLREDAPDRAAWDAAVAPHAGRSWLDIPWFFGETFFYRRLLEATGYFGGPLAGRDPFAAEKASEWAPGEAPARCAALLATLPASAGARLRALLLGSLWGNRADLSYNVARQLGTYAGEESDLLVDHGPAVVEKVLAHPCPRLTVIADNAGTELVMDLALIDHLLAGCGVGEITVHVKDHPMFVSDALAADLDAAVAALARHPPTAPLAAQIEAHRAARRLHIATHPFYTKSLFYPQLPPDLRADLGRASVVILKGDANYRRLCSDAHWPPETPFEEVVRDFPAPLVALRTLKAEVMVGLPPGTAQHLGAADPSWMVNGKRGVVQARV